MAESVRGIYRNGIIELLELPEDVPEGPVRVVVLEENEALAPPEFVNQRSRSIPRAGPDGSSWAREWKGPASEPSKSG